MKIEKNVLRKVNLCCFYLISQCVDTNATKLTIKQEDIKHKGKKIGSWKVVIQKL